MNCPNCGAPLKSNKCEYCGTVHANVAWNTGIEALLNCGIPFTDALDLFMDKSRRHKTVDGGECIEVTCFGDEHRRFMSENGEIFDV